ncbi:MAG: ABC transporter permease [Defluviitaleaceae bacterium]|nr:ABC transporter permease [Defluviitaleaceae bacterium]
MKKILHIAKANVLRSKSAAVSLFLIILIISGLATIAISLFMDVDDDFLNTVERMNGSHSVMIIPRALHNSIFDEIILNDPRVSEFERTETLIANGAIVYYGALAETNIIIANIDIPANIAAPQVIARDKSVAPAYAIYLPSISQAFGYNLGDAFVIHHRNREIEFTIAGFFDTTDMPGVNFGTMRVFVPSEGYERLTRYFGRSVLMMIRFYDMNDSWAFNQVFSDDVLVDVAAHSFVFSIQEFVSAIQTVYIFFAVILLFAFILISISLLVVRFRVADSIENTIHEIGVLKAQGYTSHQIIACYLMEYGVIAMPAAILGIIVVIPVFSFIRFMLFTLSATPWSVGVNPLAGIFSAMAIIFILLVKVFLSTQRIKKLPPITALRGGISTNNFRRNFFPLHQFTGNVHLGLGLKNMFAYVRLYAMIGVVIASAAFALTSTAAIYQTFVADQMTLAAVAGMEANEVLVTVTRHTDAFALATEIEQLPQVRMTTMAEITMVRVEDFDARMTTVSDDFSQFETFVAGIGRMPVYDNEIALPRSLAQQLNRQMGDSVRVTVSGITQEFIITGYFSTLGGIGSAAITYDGIKRLNPNFTRSTISIYLHEGVTVEAFEAVLTQQFGVLNVFQYEENDSFATARARAEERIAFYLENFDVDSVEYAVILDGEIIISGSSGMFQIERIANHIELVMATAANVIAPMTALTYMIFVISVIVVALILSMTVRAVVAKRRRELGTLKAVGYTTSQLVRQMAISFLPMTTLGIIVGCVSGTLLISPMISTAMSASGVLNMVLFINPLVVVALGTAILIVTYLVAHISARSIKNISVYELLSE